METKSGLKPIFTDGYLQDILEDFEGQVVNQTIAILVRVGETFVNDARLNGEYSDDTGNLRSSLGYIILNNGEIINSKFSHRNTEGKVEAFNFAEELRKEYSKGLVLVGFAGMEYAASVESKGYDVISGSAPTRQIMENAFAKFK